LILKWLSAINLSWTCLSGKDRDGMGKGLTSIYF
jgi:hypothetical protein